MRANNDALFGVVFIGFGLAVVWYARGFPNLLNQQYGSSLFPSLIGAGFVGCGVILALSGIYRRMNGAPWMRWVKTPTSRLLDAAGVVGGLLFYLLVSEKIGFLATSIILLTFWFVRFRCGGVAFSLMLACAVTFAVDYAFRKLLLVPLPLGPFPPLY